MQMNLVRELEIIKGWREENQFPDSISYLLIHKTQYENISCLSEQVNYTNLNNILVCPMAAYGNGHWTGLGNCTVAPNVTTNQLCDLGKIT